jgi:hypothetical protein
MRRRSRISRALMLSLKRAEAGGTDLSETYHLIRNRLGSTMAKAVMDACSH